MSDSRVSQVLKSLNLQVTIEDGRQWAVALHQRVTKLSAILPRFEAQDIEISEQGSPVVILFVQVDNLSHGVGVIFPARVVWRWVILGLVGGARNISVDGDIERTQGISQVEPDADFEGHKLEGQRVFQSLFAQTVREIHQRGVGGRDPAQDAPE